MPIELSGRKAEIGDFLCESDLRGDQNPIIINGHRSRQKVLETGEGILFEDTGGHFLRRPQDYAQSWAAIEGQVR